MATLQKKSKKIARPPQKNHLKRKNIEQFWKSLILNIGAFKKNLYKDL